MAVGQEALDIILRLQGVPTYTAGMSEASAANDKFAASSKRASGMSNEAAASSERQAGAAALVSKAMKATGLGFAAAAIEGIKMSMNFNRQMEMLHTQAGATQGEVERMKGAVLSMAGTVPQGPLELAKGLYHLESIGLRGAAAVDALKTAAQGAAVGNAHLEDVTTALGAAWIVGAKGAGSLHNVMGILNATVGAGNMKMEELVQSLGSGIIPVSKIAHLSIQDIGAALATLTDSGFSASSAMAQLGTALHFIYAPTSKAKKALESIGLTSRELFNEMSGPNGLHGALALLKSHLEGVGGGAEQAEKMGEILPGGRGKVLMTLIETLDRLDTKKKNIIATSSNFDEAFKRTMEQPAVKIQNAWSSLQATLIELGHAMEGPATSALVKLATAAGGVLSVILLITDHGKLLVPIIEAMTVAWIAYKGAMIAMAVWEGVAGAIGMVGDAMRAYRLQLVLTMAAERAAALSMAETSGVALGTSSASKWKTAGSLLGKVGGAAMGVGILLGLNQYKDQIDNYLAKEIGGPFAKGANPINTSSMKKEMQAKVMQYASSHPYWAHQQHIPGYAAGGTMSMGGGYAIINENQAGETVWLPGGSSVQPSPASSMLSPRAHTPNPAPVEGGQQLFIEAYLELPSGAGRGLYKLITKSAALKTARA
jgi:TP901 family phage tail tape measure protein